MIPALALGCIAFTAMIAWLAWQCSRAATPTQPEPYLAEEVRRALHPEAYDPFHPDFEVGHER